MNERLSDTVADRRVHPGTVPLRFLKDAPSTLLGLPAAYAFISDTGVGQILVVAAAVGAVALTFQWLAWRSFRYGIGEHDLVIQKGILSRTRRSIPFHRIQDVDIERGPLARLFGLAKLRIETGGSGGDEGVLDSVTVAEAERLRTALRAVRGAGVAVTVETPPPAQVIFEMPIPRVFALGLYNFSMVYLAGIFAVLQTFDQWLPFDIYDPARWIGLVDDRLHGRFSLAAIAAVAFLAVLLGVLTGIARTVSRDYGFRLTLEEAGFRRERGLFTRNEVMLPRRRVQLALLQTGPLRRMRGWYALSFQTLSAGQREDASRQGVAPLARREEVERILAAQDGWRAADPETLTMVSSRHVVRRLIFYGLLPVAAIAAAAVAIPAALFALPVIPLLVAAAFLERRFHRYGAAGGMLFVQTGILRQRQWIIPLRRIQSLRLTRTWLQRRLGLASLSIDTAGAALFEAPSIVDVREATARELANNLLTNR